MTASQPDVKACSLLFYANQNHLHFFAKAVSDRPPFIPAVASASSIKFHKRIAAGIVDKVREQLRRLKFPKGHSVRTGSINYVELDLEVDGQDAFDFLAPAKK